MHDLHTICTAGCEHPAHDGPGTPTMTPTRAALRTSALGAVIGGLSMAAVFPWLAAPGLLVGAVGGVGVGLVPSFFPVGPTARTVVSSFAALLLSWAGTLHASALLVQIQGSAWTSGPNLALAGAALVLLGPLSALIVCRRPEDKTVFRLVGAAASLPFIVVGAWFGNGLCVGLSSSLALAQAPPW